VAHGIPMDRALPKGLVIDRDGSLFVSNASYYM